MKLNQLTEDGVTKERSQTSKPKTKVWQKEAGQAAPGKKLKSGTADPVGGQKPTYRWSSGKPMSGDGYKDSILKVGH